MAMNDGFPATALTLDATEARKALAGMVIRDTSGNARAGISPRHTSALVTAKASMAVDVAAFEGVAVRGGGPIFMANDGTVVVPITPAPVSNSRIDVIYFKQNESASPYSDIDNTPVLAAEPGTPAPIPSKPSIPTGAVELATVLVPAGVSATNAGGVVITQTFQYTTTTGGTIWVRNAAELAALTQYSADTRALQIDTGLSYRFVGGSWVSESVGQRLVVPSSVSGGSVSASGVVTVSAGSTVAIRGVFAAPFTKHLVVLECESASVASQLTMQLATGGTALTSGYYAQSMFSVAGSTSAGAGPTSNAAAFPITVSASAAGHFVLLWVTAAATTATKLVSASITDIVAGTGPTVATMAGSNGDGSVRDGLVIIPSSGTWSGRVSIYALAS